MGVVLLRRQEVRSPELYHILTISKTIQAMFGDNSSFNKSSEVGGAGHYVLQKIVELEL